MSLKYNASVISGTFTGMASGAVAPGPQVNVVTRQGYRKVSDLSALVGAAPATSGLSVSVKWQVSNDGVNWVDLATSAQNAAPVAYVTGPATARSQHFPAPDGAYGFAQARPALVVGGSATGTLNDAYSIGLSYRQVVGGVTS